MSNLIPLGELEKMASYIARSRLFGAKDESQAMALMLLAQSENMHPMAAVQDFDIVQGRPARKTHSILARFQACGGSVNWKEISETRACGVFSHPQGGELEVEWTFDQAKKIGLTGKDNWKNYPKAMLRARCIAEGVRAVYPAAIGGMLSVEEANDTAQPAPAKDMGHAELVESVDQVIAQAIKTETDADALAFWKANSPKFVKFPSDFAKLKEAVANHRAAMRARTVESPEEQEQSAEA